MGTDEWGRWKADPNEPFNGALDVFTVDLARGAVGNPVNYGRVRRILWFFAASFVALGLWGPSRFFLALGVLLALALLVRMIFRLLK